MKSPKTLLRVVLGMGLAFAATADTAGAAPLRVEMTANFTLAPLIAGAGALSLGFDLAEPIPGVIAEGTTSFVVENISIDASLDGTFNSTVNQVGWFNYGDFSYFGIDVRLSDLLAPGDYIQLILTTPQALFSGATSAPTLDRGSLSGLQGTIAYYEPGNWNPAASGLLSEATYQAGPSVVPEPTATLLVSLGMGLIATRRRRRRRV